MPPSRIRCRVGHPASRLWPPVIAAHFSGAASTPLHVAGTGDECAGPFGQIDEIPSYESGCYRRSRLNPSAPLPWQKDRAAAKGSRDGPSLHRNARTREAGCGGITLAPICETDRDNCVARASWLNSRRPNRGRLCQVRFKAPVAQERQIPECHAPALVERKKSALPDCQMLGGGSPCASGIRKVPTG